MWLHFFQPKSSPCSLLSVFLPSRVLTSQEVRCDPKCDIQIPIMFSRGNPYSLENLRLLLAQRADPNSRATLGGSSYSISRWASERVSLETVGQNDQPPKWIVRRHICHIPISSHIRSCHAVRLQQFCEDEHHWMGKKFCVDSVPGRDDGHVATGQSRSLKDLRKQRQAGGFLGINYQFLFFLVMLQYYSV